MSSILAWLPAGDQRMTAVAAASYLRDKQSADIQWHYKIRYHLNRYKQIFWLLSVLQITHDNIGGSQP